MEKKVAHVATPKSVRTSAKKHQSILRTKTPNKELQMISSLDDSDVEEVAMESNKNTVNTESQIPVTPKRRRRTWGATQQLMETPKSKSISQAEARQTPRRSARKSIKPVQDYEDIVANKSLRSLKKNEKHSSLDEKEEDEERDVHKWTPSKVGRVSEKRKSRKRRYLAGKKMPQDDQHIDVDEDVLEVIANDEDENKENVEPQEQLRNRKSPKDSESKAKPSRRSNEILGLKPEQIMQLNTSHSILHKTAPQKEEEGNFENVKVSKIRSGNLELSELGLVPIDFEEPVTVCQSENVQELPLNENANVITLEKPKAGDTILETSTCIIISPILDSDVQQQEQTLAKNQKFQAEIETIDSERFVYDEERRPTTTDAKDLHAAEPRLDTSDCMVISPELESDSQVVEYQQKDGANSTDREPAELELTNYNIPSLLISDDEEDEQMEEEKLEAENCNDNIQPLANKMPKILINDQTPVSVKKTRRDIKNVIVVTPRVKAPATPKLNKPKPYRFPTPYKSTKPEQLPRPLLEENTAEEVSNNSRGEPIPVKLNLTTLEPKEIVLRSIRKRSFSACIERPVRKQVNRVKFHSPANQTAIIDEFDLLIAKSAKKAANRDALASEVKNNVTQRRKRSLSVDESMMHPQFKLKLGPLTPSRNKATPQKVQPRLKIPNFAAIHQRQFNKMENVVEHVKRKAERAKELINSSSKIRSTQKSGFVSNNQNIGPSGGVAGTAGIKKLRLGKPNALKKIDLSDNGINSAAPLEITQISSDDDNAEAGEKNTVCSLPNPYLVKNLAIIKPMTVGKKLQPAAAATKKAFKPTQQEQQPHQHQQPQYHYNNKQKPPFNLSTHITRNQNSSLLEKAEAQAAAAIIATTTIHASSTTAQSTDKVSSRRQRHMDMFKGRAASGRGASSKEKSSEIIRGVRSNRRFDLQMQHRKNLTQNHI